MKDLTGLEPLRLHWWREKPNFGDAINPLVVGHIASRPVVHAGPRKADMLAIGSMIQVVKRTHKTPRDDGSKITVWGSGLLNPVFGHDFLDHVDLALVRGPITAALLKREMTQFGDPGLLIDTVLPCDRPSTDRIGVVPHISMMGTLALETMLASDPALTLIDPRGDAADVCLQIASCAQIVSASLHGLIIADAYGVPNTWLYPQGQSWLKYHDYAASIGRRDMTHPITLDEARDARPGEIAYTDGIEAARAALRSSFPAHLKSSALRA
ncbi:polysaccharide pyruvyl transferase family protein [Sulfitobacter sp. S190]|uniref:polysaccharide pyruvyl transferase family protein n=1 Tax=Sulfitobacter sp. S190 TaxID=2867022 RepID=UPI0021A6C5AA|nr:polysaccharide pyruvyl transferase family protein [Sulfitobacter sp. S190]UWR23979.1 polysaccharide pyruvyl transferase family protein [Sulfitobacter sp. S190]